MRSYIYAVFIFMAVIYMEVIRKKKKEKKRKTLPVIELDSSFKVRKLLSEDQNEGREPIRN